MSTPIRPPLRPLALLVAALALGACSSSNDDDGPASGGDGAGDPGDGAGDPGDGTGDPGDGTEAPGTADEVVSDSPDALSGAFTDVGFVFIDQGDAFGDGSATASFVRFGAELPSAELLEAYRGAADTCTVSVTDVGVGVPTDGGPDLEDIDIDFDILDAGENIVFTSPSGTWLTLPREELFGFLVYAAETIPQPVPTGLVVDVEGAKYPAFSGVPVVDVEPLGGVSPASGPIGADTVFGWDAQAGSNALVEIDAFEIAVDGTSSTVRSVVCLAADDGEFAFPAATREALGAEFAAASASFARVGTTYVQRGNTLLAIENRSGAD